MQAVEIQTRARALLDAHGAKALAEAAQKARTAEEDGRKNEAQDWRRIEAALREMQGPRAT